MVARTPTSRVTFLSGCHANDLLPPNTRFFVQGERVMLLLYVTSTWLALQAPALIYKCVGTSGLVSYSETPCKRSDKVQQIKHLPLTPSGAGSTTATPSNAAPAANNSAGASSQRVLPPPLLGECRNEVIVARQQFDAELNELERTIGAHQARLKEIAQDEEIAGTSRVAEAWLQRLTEDKVTVQRQVTELTQRRNSIYDSEKARYEELKKRCGMGANPGV